MSRIFFDSNLFIYLVEDGGTRGKRVSDILDRMKSRGDELVTSTLTLGEVLVKPLAAKDHKLVLLYESTLAAPNVLLVPFDRAAASLFAVIREDRNIKAQDAIQLACAATVRCDLFVTNDDRLSRKVVPGIQFITSLDRAPI